MSEVQYSSENGAALQKEKKSNKNYLYWGKKTLSCITHK